MELKEIDYIYTVREISDFADYIFGIKEDNYIFKYGGVWGYKDVKKHRHKEEFMYLLCKLNHINERLHYDGYLTNAPTLSEIEECERERETLYITIKEKLNGEYSKYYSNVHFQEQQIIGLPKILDTNEAMILRTYLIEKGYISNQTDENSFLYWFGCLNTHSNPNPIKWIKKNSRTRLPSKKSLLDLLILVGYNENQIKQNINNAFIIDGGKKFKAQDYTKYQNWSSDVISEYHIEIENIINKSKK